MKDFFSNTSLGFHNLLFSFCSVETCRTLSGSHRLQQRRQASTSSPVIRACVENCRDGALDETGHHCTVPAIVEHKRNIFGFCVTRVAGKVQHLTASPWWCIGSWMKSMSPGHIASAFRGELVEWNTKIISRFPQPLVELPLRDATLHQYQLFPCAMVGADLNGFSIFQDGCLELDVQSAAFLKNLTEGVCNPDSGCSERSTLEKLAGRRV